MRILTRQKVFSYFEVAGRVASNRQDNRAFWLGAIGIRRDGAVVHAFNSPSQEKTPEAHAEYRLCRKLDVGATVYVARVKRCDGGFAIAKPCRTCEAALRAKRVRRVYYTIGSNEYGTMDLD